MKKKMLMACVLLAMMGSGCSKNESTTGGDSNGRTAYVSDQEQYVQSLQQEISIDDPDGLLKELNESIGDNSENAELVRLKSVEASPVQEADLLTPSDVLVPTETNDIPSAKTPASTEVAAKSVDTVR